MSFYPFLGEGSPTKIDYRKKGTLILTSLLENLEGLGRAGFLVASVQVPVVALRLGLCRVEPTCILSINRDTGLDHKIEFGALGPRGMLLTQNGLFQVNPGSSFSAVRIGRGASERTVRKLRMGTPTATRMRSCLEPWMVQTSPLFWVGLVKHVLCTGQEPEGSLP